MHTQSHNVISYLNSHKNNLSKYFLRLANSNIMQFGIFFNTHPIAILLHCVVYSRLGDIEGEKSRAVELALDPDTSAQAQYDILAALLGPVFVEGVEPTCTCNQIYSLLLYQLIQCMSYLDFQLNIHCNTFGKQTIAHIPNKFSFQKQVSAQVPWVIGRQKPYSSTELLASKATYKERKP